MLLSTPGFVLHTTPYGESAVVAKVFTRQLGMRSYLLKGVRGPRGRVKQNLLQPLSCVDMVVYDNPKRDLNYVKELSPRHPERPDSLPPSFSATLNALRFFMTEVLYKSLREEEPMPDLFDYVESALLQISFSPSSADFRPPTSDLRPPTSDLRPPTSDFPIVFLLAVLHHLGVEPLDNHSSRESLFDLQEGRFVATFTETTLPPALSALLHEYLSSAVCQLSTFHFPLSTFHSRRALLDALIAYCQLHLSGFRQFNSHEILHTILR